MTKPLATLTLLLALGHASARDNQDRGILEPRPAYSMRVGAQDHHVGRV